MTGAMLSLRGSWPPYVGITVASAAAIVASKRYRSVTRPHLVEEAVR